MVMNCLGLKGLIMTAVVEKKREWGTAVSHCCGDHKVRAEINGKNNGCYNNSVRKKILIDKIKCAGFFQNISTNLKSYWHP